MEEERELLICNSNMFVPYVLSECLSNKRKQFVVASDTSNIIQFINSLNLANITILEYTSGTIKTIMEEKKKIKTFLSKNNITRVVFYHTEFGGLANWLLLILAKREVRIEYHKVFDRIPYPKAKWYQGLKIKVKQLFYFNYMPMVLNNGTRIFPSLPDDFYNKIKAITIPASYDDQKVKERVKLLIDDLGIKAKTLLVSGSVVEMGYVSDKEYTQVTDNLINIIGSDNVALKVHPRFNDIFGKELSLSEIPKYIPANVMLDVFDTYIGYSSTLLVEAAQKGKKVISTLLFMRPLNIESQQMWHNFLESRLNGKGIIYYPKSIEELMQYFKL